MKYSREELREKQASAQIVVHIVVTRVLLLDQLSLDIKTLNSYVLTKFK